MSAESRGVTSTPEPPFWSALIASFGFAGGVLLLLAAANAQSPSAQVTYFLISLVGFITTFIELLKR